MAEALHDRLRRLRLLSVSPRKEWGHFPFPGPLCGVVGGAPAGALPFGTLDPLSCIVASLPPHTWLSALSYPPPTPLVGVPLASASPLSPPSSLPLTFRPGSSPRPADDGGALPPGLGPGVSPPTIEWCRPLSPYFLPVPPSLLDPLDRSRLQPPAHKYAKRSKRRYVHTRLYDANFETLLSKGDTIGKQSPNVCIYS